MKKSKYFSLETKDNKASLYIYGDITSYPWMESDVSAYNLSKQLEDLKDVDSIDVFINSYGGEVAEGIAIYNALKRFKGKVTTYVDGFACSIASVIFMAGSERVMNESSLLLIHNAWSYECGDANALRKAAEDLDKINELSIGIYMDKINMKREELQEYLDKETWLSSEEALNYGFATKVDEDKEENASQSYKSKIVEQLLGKKTRQAKSVTISIDDNGELVITSNDDNNTNDDDTDADDTSTNTTENDTVLIDDETNDTDGDGDDVSDDDGNNTDDTSTDDKTDEDDSVNNSFKEKLLNVFEGGR